MPQRALLLRLKASQDLPAFNHGRGQAQPPNALHVHKELADGIDMVEVANLFAGASGATVWEVFKKRPADEVYVCLQGNSDSLITTNLL